MTDSFPSFSKHDHVLVTGCAGFIGMHVAERLCGDGVRVTGVDNFEPYYDPALKEARSARLVTLPQFSLRRLDLADADATRALFCDGGFTCVIHLAAQAGVRYSLEHPEVYLRNNVTAFGHVLEGCRHYGVRHLVYASSSSVYGANHTLPFSEDQRTDHPVSLYAATKKANELMAHSYSHLFKLPTTGLRFFTVYGPWGRPDMSPMLFADAILSGKPIKVFNYGKMQRDYTFIDDIVEGVVRVATRLPDTIGENPPSAPDPKHFGGNLSGGHPLSKGSKEGVERDVPYAIYNIGGNNAVALETFIDTLSRVLGKNAIRDYQAMQSGDVVATYADVSRLEKVTAFAPRTPLEEGLKRFAEWYVAWRESKT
ncbi:MAG: NAD-dependent epimerase/dehydratase family protein [Burkholderiales bacterium]|jgi:UDP-glucuronate 4-epimerase|nr:NAD-dependent epimerase/dehydratase family protein [Burkholderiales bacterium]